SLKSKHVTALRCDLSSSTEIQALAARLFEEPTGVSALIHCAGVGRFASVDQLAVEDWDASFAINTRALYLLCRAIMPSMCTRQAGDIVVIGSTSFNRSYVGGSAYAASKAALVRLTQTIREESRTAGVRVHLVSPGLTLSDFSDLTRCHPNP